MREWFVPTCALLLSLKHSWVVHGGWWSEGRGSARTLVAGGPPLSDKEAFALPLTVLFSF